MLIDVAAVCFDSWLIQNGSELHSKCGLGLIPRYIRWHTHKNNDSMVPRSKIITDSSSSSSSSIRFFPLFSVFNYNFCSLLSPLSRLVNIYFLGRRYLSVLVGCCFCRAKFITRTNAREKILCKNRLLRRESLWNAPQTFFPPFPFIILIKPSTFVATLSHRRPRFFLLLFPTFFKSRALQLSSTREGDVAMR